MNTIIEKQAKTCWHAYVFRTPDGGRYDLRTVGGIECRRAFRGRPCLGV